MLAKTGFRSIVLLCSIIIVFSVLVAVTLQTEVSASEALPQEINNVLSDYSQFVSSGTTSQLTSYAPEMVMLIAERRDYYQEFFANGLHSKLIGFDSQFSTDDDVVFSKIANTYQVDLVEKVTMLGKPVVTNPEDYPLIKAAKWAIAKTSDTNAKNYFSRYIESMTAGVNESSKNAVKIVFVIRHNIEIDVENGSYRIAKDTFTDKSSDNGKGFDNVVWSGKEFTRQKPDWSQMIDYRMYHVSIETLGRELLADYEVLAKNLFFPMNSILSDGNRQNARWYISHYTSNPGENQKCSGIDVLQDTSYYNSAYSYVWTITGCDDCTDYVSQALHYGGIPTDSTWFPNPYNVAWSRVGGLNDYLVSVQRGTTVTELSSLLIGDLAFVYDSNYAIPWRHVVMVSQVDPHLFSGHTNDRLDYAFDSTINVYMRISYPQWLYLPMLSKNISPTASEKQNPYPAPSDDDETVTQPYPAP